MEIHRNGRFPGSWFVFVATDPLTLREKNIPNSRDWRTIFQKTMITLSFKGEVIFHLVMTLWHFIFTGIYKKLEEIWRFMADICKKLEEMEQNTLLLTTRDDVKIHEEICELSRTIESLHKELNAIHVRLSKQKQQLKEKDVKETIKQKGTKESPRRNRSPSPVRGL